jgi:hypothetical protein
MSQNGGGACPYTGPPISFDKPDTAIYPCVPQILPWAVLVAGPRPSAGCC